MTKIIGLYQVKYLVNLNIGDMFIPIDGACPSNEVFVKAPEMANGNIPCVCIFSDPDHTQLNRYMVFARDKKVIVVRIGGNFVVEEVE